MNLIRRAKCLKLQFWKFGSEDVVSSVLVVIILQYWSTWGLKAVL